MAPTQCEPFRLLDLPLDIRVMIFSELLIAKQIIHDNEYCEGEETKMCVHIQINLKTLLPLLINSRRRPANVGCIILDTLDPSKYKPSCTRRTSFLVTGWESDCTWEMTTYACGSCPDLRVLETNRQIYRESSAIFYSQNMFYTDGPSVLVPFLRDRGTRTLSLIRKLSIGYPSPAQETGTGFGAIEHGMYDRFYGNPNMWEDVCYYVSLNMPGLAQLDLRVARGFVMEIELEEDEEPNFLQTKSDFPAQQRKVLATIGPETELTVSETGWCSWEVWPGISSNDVFFSPLQPWLRNEISQLRVRNGLTENLSQEFPLQARKANLASLWEEILHERSPMVYC